MDVQVVLAVILPEAIGNLTPHDKAGKMVPRRFPTYFDVFDTSAARTLMAPGDQRVDGAACAFDDRLDGAVRAVHHPTL